MVTLILVGTLLVVPAASTYDDMNDEDFKVFLQSHDKMREYAAEYSESAARGCVKTATTAAFTGKGLPALCLGCAVGAIGEVAADFAVPKDRRMNEKKE